MAITYPLSMPQTKGIRSGRWRLVSNTLVHSSPLTRHEQVLERPGAVWTGEFQLPAMTRDDAAAWTAFFVALRGRFGTFFGYDPGARSPRGGIAGSVTATGGGGRSMNVTGLAGNAPYFRAGDYVQNGDFLYMVVEDASASPLSVEPMLRATPSGSVIYNNPTAIMRLTTDDIGWDQDEAQHYGFTFQAVEALR